MGGGEEGVGGIGVRWGRGNRGGWRGEVGRSEEGVGEEGGRWCRDRWSRGEVG